MANSLAQIFRWETTFVCRTTKNLALKPLIFSIIVKSSDHPTLFAISVSLLCTRWRQAAGQSEPALAWVIDQLQLTPFKFLEPPPPLDRLQILFFCGKFIVSKPNAVRTPRNACRKKAAGRAPVVNRQMIRSFVDCHIKSRFYEKIKQCPALI